MNILQEILDWSEVWALLIPLGVLVKYPKQPNYFKPVIMYLWLALIIDLVIDVGWKFKSSVPEWLQDNNFLYNIHSIIRFICFSSFFILLNQPYLQKLKKLIPYLALLFAILNFSVLNENFFQRETFSSRLLATEAGLLLLYCLLYYLYRLKEDPIALKKTGDFWVVLGLSIYVVLNFFYFLFYSTLIAQGQGELVMKLWNYHNGTFIILCIFIAKGFYAARKY